MNIFISIVSHGHGSLIKEINVLKVLSEKYTVLVKNNIVDKLLLDYCIDSNIILLDSDYNLGFGANNNIVFNYCLNNLGAKDSDFFIVLNPDVDISISSIENLISEAKESGSKFSCINLVKKSGEYDNSIRRFPNALNFFMSYVFNINNTVYDKSIINESCYVDWAAGSFLMFGFGHYKQLGGFDESYFMYCEDIDICYRSYLSGVTLLYHPNIPAIHLAKHNNRKILSKHFFWHLSSVFKFLMKKSIIKR